MIHLYYTYSVSKLPYRRAFISATSNREFPPDFLKPYDLKIIKKDNYGNLMPNITFSVYTSDKINDTKDGNITVYHCSDYLGDYTTDSNG